MNIFLQIFIYCDVFVLGIISVFIIRHFKAHQHIKKTPVHHNPTSQNITIPHEVREHLIEQASQRLQKDLDAVIEKFNTQLLEITDSIGSLTKNHTEEIINKQLTEFNSQIKKYEENNFSSFKDIEEQAQTIKTSLENQIKQEIETKKQRLINYIDTSLSDTVMSIVFEALEHQVDLGSQSQYLLAKLEEHKEEFKNTVNNAA